MAQAASAPAPAPQHTEPSFDVLRWEPFEFSIDPAELLDEETPPDATTAESADDPA
ncbi:hypothetical protein ACWD8I_31740 [Micromonospora arida]|uniref:hypothetical protein n=1 Tax=Micromonospora arida TaxID=2203715 RepID=UPI0033A20D30